MEKLERVQTNGVDYFRLKTWTISDPITIELDVTGDNRLFLAIQVEGTANIAAFESLEGLEAQAPIVDSQGSTAYDVTDDTLVYQLELYSSVVRLQITPTGEATISARAESKK
jgi:hypothetical protein